jgi:hypothetical protein
MNNELKTIWKEAIPEGTEESNEMPSVRILHNGKNLLNTSQKCDRLS